MNASRNKILLGILHIVVGISILIIWYGLDLDLIGKITALTNTLPLWTLLVAGLIEGTYWIGGLIPGQTYMGLYLLGHECQPWTSSLMVFYIWFGVVIGLCISYGAARFFQRGGNELNEEHPWSLRSMLSRALLAFYPSAAATHMFERGFGRRTFLPAFIPIIVSGLVVLSLYTFLLCMARDTVQQGTDELGFLFAGALILWGGWRIFQGIRSKNT